MDIRETRRSRKEDAASGSGKQIDNSELGNLSAPSSSEYDAESTVVGICDSMLDRLNESGTAKRLQPKGVGARERTLNQAE